MLVAPFLVLTSFTSIISCKLALIPLVLAVLSTLPWPSPGRIKLEKRGYAMTMAVHYWLTGEITPKLKQEIKIYFVGWPYYKMSWSPTSIDTWLDATEQAIKSGTLIDNLIYSDVLQFLVNRGLLKT